MLAALVAMLAAPVTSTAPTADPTIVVTAAPIASLEAEHDRCLRAKCPVREDITATLAYAEALFVAADYKRAKSVLNAGIRRNRQFAPAEPVAVSQLYRAASRVAIHLGDAERYDLNVRRIVRALKAGAVRDEAEILLGEIEAADMHLKLGSPRDSNKRLQVVERRAKTVGLPQIAALARLRIAYLPYYIRGDRRQAIRRLNEVAVMPGVDIAGVRIAARVMAVRLAAKPDEEPDLRPLLASPDRLPERQILIWAPPSYLPRTGQSQPRIDLTAPIRSVSEGFQDRWADFGFRVRADGKVDEVTVLRDSGSTGWVDLAARQIAGRFYTPLPQAAADDTGSYRIERHTYTSYYASKVGTRINTRDGIPRVEVLDLTPS